MRYIIFIVAFIITVQFLFLWNKSFGQTIDTGNILSNSTFGTGTTYSTTGWTVDEHTHGHHGTGSFATLGGGNNPGGSVAAEENTSIEQTITLSEKTNMTTQEIQNGWSSTISADIWYWNQYNNTTTLKQTITGSDGSSSTQQRVIQDTGCGGINCGSFTNYTDTHIQGSNTQTDFDIKVGVTNTNNRSGHWGPDIDDVQLKIQYTYINPIDETSQDIIDDIGTDIETVIEDIEFEQDFSWNDGYFDWEEEFYFEENTWEDEFYFGDEYIIEDNFDTTAWEDDFEMEESFDDFTMEEFEETSFEEFNFEEFEEIYFDELPSMGEFEEFGFEEFDEVTFEEMPIEETFLENEFAETSIMEEIFEEEFEEDFTSFLEDTGLEEEFTQFLEDEGLTQEEFFEEITEEEFDDEFTEESFDEFEEEFEEIETVEESPPETITNEEETVELEAEPESEITEESEVAQNEPTNEPQQEESPEDESSSESTEESEISTAESEEQDDIRQEGRDEVDTEDRVTTDVAKVESTLKQKLKTIAKQIAKVTKVNTQNLSKEDLFFKSNTALNAYKKVNFYKSKDIYTDQGLDLFNQIDLGVYSKEIYGDITLASYSQNDPVEVHRVQLLEAQQKTNKLKLELKALKNDGT